MSIARQCEAFFTRAEDIGSGVAALGDMLQWAPRTDVQNTLTGLGAVLRQLGGNIQALSETYFHESYERIVELEDKDRQEALVNTALTQLQAHAAARKSITEELKEILDEATAKPVVQVSDSMPRAGYHSER